MGTDFNRFLVWGYTPEESLSLEALHLELGLPGLRVIGPRQTGLTILELLEEPDALLPGECPAEPVVLMPKGTSSTEAGDYLRNFKRAAIPRPIFAVVTETSQHWAFDFLTRHLMEERDEVREMMARKSRGDQ